MKTKNNLIKILALAIVFLTLVSLTGCGKSESPPVTIAEAPVDIPVVETPVVKTPVKEL